MYFGPSGLRSSKANEGFSAARAAFPDARTFDSLYVTTPTTSSYARVEARSGRRTGLRPRVKVKVHIARHFHESSSVISPFLFDVALELLPFTFDLILVIFLTPFNIQHRDKDQQRRCHRISPKRV
jgi:hypothetical protein